MIFLMAYWYLANCKATVSLASLSLSRSVTRPSRDRSSVKLITRNDGCSISDGSMASDPYIKENGVYPIAELGDLGAPKVLREIFNPSSSMDVDDRISLDSNP